MTEMEEINIKIQSLFEIIVDEIEEVWAKEENGGKNDPKATFIIAGALSMVVGWYGACVHSISPALRERFHNMMEKQDKQFVAEAERIFKD